MVMRLYLLFVDEDLGKVFGEVLGKVRGRLVRVIRVSAMRKLEAVVCLCSSLTSRPHLAGPQPAGSEGAGATEFVHLCTEQASLHQGCSFLLSLSV